MSDPAGIQVTPPPSVRPAPRHVQLQEHRRGQLAGLLGKLTFWLDEFRRSDAFQSFDLPVVGPALDKVLGVADAFRDKLLIDDRDNGNDGSTTLLFDLNAALAAAGLGDRMRAERTADGKLRLVSNDAAITGFTARRVGQRPRVYRRRDLVWRRVQGDDRDQPGPRRRPATDRTG